MTTENPTAPSLIEQGIEILRDSQDGEDLDPAHLSLVEAAVNNNMVSEIAKVAGTCLTMALEAASKEPQPQNRVFSPQNWIKAKVCLTNINFAIRNYFNMLPMMPGGAEISKKLAETLTLPVDNFEYRWEAD